MPRLFVAIDLPDAVKAPLLALREEQPGVRWSRPEQLHLTLRFIGEADEARAGEALRAVRAPALLLRPARIGVFPNPRRPHVLWAGIEPDPALLALRESVEQAIREAGFPPDPKPFSPHVTLARLNRPEREWVRQTLHRHVAFGAPPFESSAFHLYESRLSPGGSVYRKIESYPLARAPEG